MEDKQLIYREKNPYDGRSVLIKLTDYGCQMREKSKETVLGFNDVLQQNINPEDLLTFKKVSNQILKMVNNREFF